MTPFVEELIPIDATSQILADRLTLTFSNIILLVDALSSEALISGDIFKMQY